MVSHAFCREDSRGLYNNYALYLYIKLLSSIGKNVNQQWLHPGFYIQETANDFRVLYERITK